MNLGNGMINALHANEIRVGFYVSHLIIRPKKNLFYQYIRGVNYSEKSVRRFLGLETPGNFSRDSAIFSPKFKGFGDFFQSIFSKYFPLFFSPNFFRNFLRNFFKTK